MNIKSHVEQTIYFNNLKLAEIRANIENEIKRVDVESMNEPSNSIYSAELNELRNNLEDFYQKIGWQGDSFFYCSLSLKNIKLWKLNSTKSTIYSLIARG